MPNLRRFLSRRCLLALASVAALLFSFAMLHPYPRQSLFGPTIRGQPWCVWSEAVRQDSINGAEHRGAREASLLVKARRWLGVDLDRMDPEKLYNHEEMLPVLLDLTSDPDVEVRRSVLNALICCDKLGDRSSGVGELRRRLEDVDPTCRMSAALVLYGMNPREPVQAVVLRELHGSNHGDRCLAIDVLTQMGQTHPELLPHLAPCAKDESEDLRARVMGPLWVFGAKALPIILQGLEDRSEMVRVQAIRSVNALGSVAKDPSAKDAVPALIRSLQDKNADVRVAAKEALLAIDPDRFPHLKAEPKIE